MTNYTELLILIKTTREQLSEKKISPEDAAMVLDDTRKKYEELATENTDPSIKKVLETLLDINQKKNVNPALN